MDGMSVTRLIEQREYGISERILRSDLTKLAILFSVFATIALRNWMPIVYMAQTAMVLMIVVDLVRRRVPVHSGVYLLGLGGFTLWCLSSAFWAVDPSRSIAGSLSVAQSVSLGAILSAYLVANKCPGFLLDCLAWSAIGLVVILVITTPVGVWSDAMQATADASTGQNRLGSTVGYHPNQLGRILVTGALLWLYKLLNTNRHRVRKCIALILLIAVLAFTKSRLSILLLFLVSTLYVIWRKASLKRTLILVPLLLAGLGGVVWAVMTVPILYDMFGFRFAAMFGIGRHIDASTTTRTDMTMIALEMFFGHPISGVGFENFAVHYFYDYSGWAVTYAHNNYAELLASVGLIGALLYYVVPVWTTCTLVKYRDEDQTPARELSRFLILLALAQLTADLGSISYASEFIQLITVALYSYAVVERQQDRGDLNCVDSGFSSKTE